MGKAINNCRFSFLLFYKYLFYCLHFNPLFMGEGGGTRAHGESLNTNHLSKYKCKSSPCEGDLTKALAWTLKSEIYIVQGNQLPGKYNLDIQNSNTWDTKVSILLCLPFFRVAIEKTDHKLGMQNLMSLHFRTLQNRKNMWVEADYIPKMWRLRNETKKEISVKSTVVYW